MPIKQNQSERGSMMIEFVLVASTFILPVLLGTFTYGFAVIRSVEAIQLTRDIGHMYSRGVDFGKQTNQDLIATQLAQGLNIVSNSGNVTGGSTGNGVIVLSTFTKIGANCPTCNNSGHVVVMRRIVIGNNGLFTTQYGSPSSSIMDPATGDVTKYSSDPSARADSFSNVLSLNDGEIGYFAESYFKNPDLAVPGLYSGLTSYQSAVF